jgi:hypothetical protein
MEGIRSWWSGRTSNPVKAEIGLVWVRLPLPSAIAWAIGSTAMSKKAVCFFLQSAMINNQFLKGFKRIL